MCLPYYNLPPGFSNLPTDLACTVSSLHCFSTTGLMEHIGFRVREDTLIYFCHYIKPAYYTETKLVLVADYKLFPVVLKMFRWAFAIPWLFWFHPFGLETKNISTQDKIVWHNFKSRIIMPNIDYAPSFFWSKSIFWHWTRAVWTWAKKQNSVQSNLALKIC